MTDRRHDDGTGSTHRRRARARGGRADGQPWIPVDRRHWSSLVLLTRDVDVHGARDRARDEVRASARSCAPTTSRGCTSRCRSSTTSRKFERRILTRELPLRAVPDERRQDPAHRLLRQVAHRGRLAVLPRDRRQRGQSRPAPRRDRQGRHQGRDRAPHDPAGGRRRAHRVHRRDPQDRRVARPPSSACSWSTCASRSIDLPEEVSDSVFNAHAPGLRRGRRSSCAPKATRTPSSSSAEADRQRTEILAQAYREARDDPRRGRCAARPTSTRAPTRATRSSIRSTAACRPTANRSARTSDVLVIAPDSEFFKYLKQSGAPLSPRGGDAMSWADLFAALRRCIWCSKASCHFSNPGGHEAHDARRCRCCDDRHAALCRARQHDRRRVAALPGSHG